MSYIPTAEKLAALGFKEEHSTRFSISSEAPFWQRFEVALGKEGIKLSFGDQFVTVTVFNWQCPDEAFFDKLIALPSPIQHAEQGGPMVSWEPLAPLLLH